MESNKQKAPLLQVQGFTVSFSRYAQGFRRVTLPGVRDLSFSLDEGELVAVPLPEASVTMVAFISVLFPATKSLG